MKDQRMGRDVDCQVFEDQLDALVNGTLSGAARRLLLLHADTCGDCSMQLRVQRHLLGSTLSELESRVPEALVDGMWGRVGEALRSDVPERRGKGFDDVLGRAGGHPPGFTRGGPGSRRGQGRGRDWLIPTLAAASIFLLFASGFLYVELDRVRSREAILTQQVEEQQRWLAELEVGPAADPVARTAALAGRSPWLRALSRQESVTVAGLRVLLERMPEDRILMTEGQLDAARRSRFPLSRSLLADVLARVDGGRPGQGGERRGVRAGDLLKALEGMNLSPDLSVPTSELMDLLS
jgi:hypothetical protein